MAHKVNNRNPHECTNIDQVRNEIDLIDHEIINLLSARTQYVHQVVKYKEATPQAIEAPKRKAEVIQGRRQWAQEVGFSPDVIEEIYKILISYYIDEEKKLI